MRGELDFASCMAQCMGRGAVPKALLFEVRGTCLLSGHTFGSSRVVARPTSQ